MTAAAAAVVVVVVVAAAVAAVVVVVTVMAVAAVVLVLVLVVVVLVVVILVVLVVVVVVLLQVLLQLCRIEDWVAVASAAIPRALWSGWDHGEAAAGELIVQVGALGHESRKVKAITTRFCTNGNLNTVVLSNGVFV